MEEEQVNDESHWRKGSFAARVWDGAKRVWRFLKRLVKGAATRVRLLVRSAYQLAADGFSLVRRAIRVFCDGMAFLTTPEVKGSSRQIAMRHAEDFDFQVFLDQDVSNNVVDKFLDGVRNGLGALRAAARMLQLLFLVTVNALKLAQGPWGWWKLLRALIGINSVYDDEDRLIIQESMAA